MSPESTIQGEEKGWGLLMMNQNQKTNLDDDEWINGESPGT